MEYLSEIAKAWRPLLAAMIGLATGNSIIGIITSAIAPSLMADAGWTKATFSMIGSLSLGAALILPVIGRLTDILGVRLTALIGLVSVPLVYLAYSFCGGSLQVYIAIYLVQTTLCVTTTAMVYTRLVVQHVAHARGLALALVTASPAIAGIFIGPILNAYVEAHGWQASYRALALAFACTGVVTYFLIPGEQPRSKQARPATARAHSGYREIFRAPAFWIFAGSMMLCNLPQTLLLTQLKILVMDQGISGTGAATLFSALSFGMLAGRLVTGVALDRFRPDIVAFIGLGVPSLGLFLIGSDLDAPAIIGLAIFFLGFAFGAEGDAVAFLVGRHFRIAVYSSVMGLMTAVMAFSTALGAVLLSLILNRTNSFDLFLYGTGVAVAIGATLLLKLKNCPVAEPSLPPAASPARDTAPASEVRNPLGCAAS